MDSLYNDLSAGIALETISKECASQEYSGLHLSKLKYNDEGTKAEEAIWHIQGIGIVAKSDLPPFTERISQINGRAKYLCQLVTLTGLDTFVFNITADNVATLYTLFARFVPKDKLKAPTIVSELNGCLAIDVSNCYLAPRQDDPVSAPCAFSEDVDPHGILAKLCGSEFFHSKENKVHFYERVSAAGGGHRFITIAPVKIQAGDIVEAQVSFMLIPLWGGEYKMMGVL